MALLDTPGDVTAFGEVLRGHRERRGVTQRQLADLSTVSIRAIRDLECGRARRPRTGTIRLIAAALRLSEHQRADLEARVRAGPGGEDTGPDPLGLLAPPEPLDGIVGRTVQVAALRQSLAAGDDRLAVITGLRGVGKTRLALEVAGQLARGDGFQVLWSPDPQAAPAPTGRRDRLRPDAPTLLIVDGLCPADDRLAAALRLLRGHRGLRVLGTAQEPTGVPGERILALPPLALPERRGHLDPQLRAPAMVVLLRHVRRVVPDFAVTEANLGDLVALCHDLDGIPVALEEVAPLFLLFEPADVLRRIGPDPLAHAEGRLLDLRTSLGAATARLTAVEAVHLRRLAEARAGWSIDEAVTITGLPDTACARLVCRLLGLGLVRPSAGAGGTEFQVLELLRRG